MERSEKRTGEANCWRRRKACSELVEVREANLGRSEFEEGKSNRARSGKPELKRGRTRSGREARSGKSALLGHRNSERSRKRSSRHGGRSLL